MTRRRGVLRAVLGGAAAFALALGGATVAVADDEPTGTITGTVTREAGGDPVEGVGVFISNVEGGFSFNGSSDASGNYAVTDLPAGEYVVRFDPETTPDLISEYWDGAADWESAERITIVGDETIPDIDASLQTAGLITGVVTRDGDGAPVEGVTVSVSATDGTGNGAAGWTQADGSFTVGGLRDGDYAVRFDAPDGSGLMDEYWDDAVDIGSATLVSVVAGETDAGIDAALATGGAISGVVTRQADGSPVEDARVLALNGSDEIVGSTRTQPDGAYRLDGLPADDYVVRFGAPDTGELASEYWENVYVSSAATPIAVNALQTVENIDAALGLVGHISGTVTKSADGSPVSGYAWIHEIGGEADAQTFDLDSEGGYRAAVAPGTYYVSFHSPGSNLVEEYWEDAATRETATTVVVAAGEEITEIDAQLESAAAIAGVVAVDSDEPHEAYVEAWDGDKMVAMAYAASKSGSYSITLPAGTYVLKASVTFYENEATHAKPQFFDGVATADLATPVTVAAGGAVGDIDFTLVPDTTGPETKPTLALSADSIRAGKDLTISGTGFEPGAKVAFELRSDPIALGTLTADAGGVLKGSLRIPASAPAGKHTLVALSGSTVIASAAVSVTAAATPDGPDSGGAASPGGGLASTGMDAPVAVVAIGLVLAVLGGMLVRRRRVES